MALLSGVDCTFVIIPVSLTVLVSVPVYTNKVYSKLNLNYTIVKYKYCNFYMNQMNVLKIIRVRLEIVIF